MPYGKSKRKVKGQARVTALKLFGIPGKMESPSDRENVCLILAHSPNAQVKELVRKARDPAYRQSSFAMLAERENLNYHDLAREFKEIQRSIGFVRAAGHLPDLMEQIMIDAKGGEVQCAKCKGTGKVKDDTCWACMGKGTTYAMGDTDRLRMALDMFSLSSKGSGVNVNLDLRNPGTKPEALESLSESIGPILNGEGKIE